MGPRRDLFSGATLACALALTLLITLGASVAYTKEAVALRPALTVGNFVDVADGITDVVSASGLALSTMDILSFAAPQAGPRHASLRTSPPPVFTQDVESRCPGGGSVKTTTRDEDHSGDLSVRDRFVTVFDACMINGRLVTGSGEFTVAAHRDEGAVEVTELEFRFNALGTDDLRWTGPARVKLRSDSRRGVEHYTVTYRDLAVARGSRGMRWNFTLDLLRPPIGEQVASLHGSITLGELHLRLSQDEAFVMAGNGYPRSGQLSAIDAAGARLQMEAGRYRYAYRLFFAGNHGVTPDEKSHSRPHGQR